MITNGERLYYSSRVQQRELAAQRDTAAERAAERGAERAAAESSRVSCRERQQREQQ